MKRRSIIEAAAEAQGAAAAETETETEAEAEAEASTRAIAEVEAATEAKVRRRFEDAVAAFDRGACVEEATGELTPDLYVELPDGPVRDAVRSAFRCLAADPPRRDRETAVREAQAALAALPAHR
jgi:hypothetical protein